WNKACGISQSANDNTTAHGSFTSSRNLESMSAHHGKAPFQHLIKLSASEPILGREMGFVGVIIPSALLIRQLYITYYETDRRSRTNFLLTSRQVMCGMTSKKFSPQECW